MRQLREQLLHLVHRGARALARRGRALNFQRADAVVALELRRAQSSSDSVAKDENGAISPDELAHIPAIEIVRRHAVGRVGLHIDLLDAAAIDEIVDEQSAPRGAERVVDVGERKPERGRLVLVDVDVQLRACRRGRWGARRAQKRVLCRHAEELVARLHQAVMAEIAAILHLDVEARGLAEFLHRRRHQREHLRVADFARSSSSRAARWHRRVIARAGALVPGLQMHEGDAGILARRRRS